MIANWISNGLGGQSMYLLFLAAYRVLPARLSITADTGSENDRITNTGERISAANFFDKYVKPYAEKNGIEAIMVRARDVSGADMPPLIDILRNRAQSGSFKELTKSISVPLFTNDRTAGRLRQSCTDKWKVRAIHQEARRRGITLLRSAIGFHAGESHRLKAEWMRSENGFDYYKPYQKRDGKLTTIKWLEHYYPLINLGMNRTAIREELNKANVPYLVTTECDMCPHQDYQRWAAHRPEVLQEIAQIESEWDGKLFFTDRRIPLLSAIEEMRQEAEAKQRQGILFEPDFGCEGAYCGI